MRCHSRDCNSPRCHDKSNYPAHVKACIAVDYYNCREKTNGGLRGSEWELRESSAIARSGTFVILLPLAKLGHTFATTIFRQAGSTIGPTLGGETMESSRIWME